MKYTTSLNEPRPATWRLLAITIAVSAVAALLVVAVATMGGCDQKPVPINPTPGNVCGVGAWFECPDHGCCFRGEYCCRNACCYEGESPSWGASRNDDAGGVARQRLSPEDARKAMPR